MMVSTAVAAELPIPTPNRLYGPHWYKVDPAKLAELRQLKPYKPVIAALLNWVWIVLIVKIFFLLPHHWFYYPIAALLIAGRAGVFLQLAHEATHGLISKNQRFNDWFGRWMACYPIGLDLKGYKGPHIRHHACPGEPCDPLTEAEKCRVTNIKNPALWLLFLKDLTGASAISVRLRYARPGANRAGGENSDYRETENDYFEEMRPTRSESKLVAIKKYGSIALVQAVIIAGLFNLNVWHYLLLWLVPLVTAHTILMRVRGIAEHGLAKQLNVPGLDQKSWGKFYTRSFGTPTNQYALKPLVWLERILIGSLNIYYHHEHHLFPKVPYYNLPKAHLLVREQVVKVNPFIYAKGYFDCLWFNLREDRRHRAAAAQARRFAGSSAAPGAPPAAAMVGGGSH